jgi:hypothetical protein
MTTYSRLKLPSGLVLKADANGWTLCEERTYGSGKRSGESYDHDLGYYGSVYSALCGLQETEMRRSGASDLTGLIEAVKRFQKHISDLLEPRLSVKVGK